MSWSMDQEWVHFDERLHPFESVTWEKAAKPTVARSVTTFTTMTGNETSETMGHRWVRVCALTQVSQVCSGMIKGKASRKKGRSTRDKNTTTDSHGDAVRHLFSYVVKSYDVLPDDTDCDNGAGIYWRIIVCFSWSVVEYEVAPRRLNFSCKCSAIVCPLSSVPSLCTLRSNRRTQNFKHTVRDRSEQVDIPGTARA